MTVELITVDVGIVIVVVVIHGETPILCRVLAEHAAFLDRKLPTQGALHAVPQPHGESLFAASVG